MILTVERRRQLDLTGRLGEMMMTPAVHPGYWSYRVAVSEKQAIVAFPKFETIGVGFQYEETWNTNLPWTCDPETIFDHIRINKCELDLWETIPDALCLEAIKMIQDAITEDKAWIQDAIGEDPA